MSAQQSVYAVLAAAGAVTAIAGARIYPDEAAQDADLPLVIHQATAADPTYSISGQVLATKTTVAVTCWSASRSQSNALADACAAALLAADMPWVERDDSVFEVTTAAYASVLTVHVWT